VPSLDRFLDAPAGATADERHNFRVAYIESALIGLISAGSVFLPVFLARLGASNLQVSLLAALPSLTGVLLAIPLGGLIQSRRNIIPWYSRGRLGGQLGYVAIAVASLVLPPDLVVPGILAIWGVVTVFSVVTSISFAVVMDATAGSRGRYELMSRRWSILGLMSGISLAIVGQALEAGEARFPLNYQVTFSALGLMGFVAFRYGSAIRVPDHPVTGAGRGGVRGAVRPREMLERVRTQPVFVAFTIRHFIYAAGTALTVPLLPLFYVRVLGAPDSWIGIIGTASAFALLIGYALWRRVSRRRGSRFVLIWATVGAALMPAVMSVTPTVELAAVIAGLGAVATAGVSLAMFDSMMATVPKGYGVTFTSVDTTLVYLAGVLAPVVAAFLADRIGIASALVVAAGVMLVGSLLFAVGGRPPETLGVAGASAGGRPEAAGATAGKAPEAAAGMPEATGASTTTPRG
jgi:hypothetical protein